MTVSKIRADMGWRRPSRGVFWDDRVGSAARLRDRDIGEQGKPVDGILMHAKVWGDSSHSQKRPQRRAAGCTVIHAEASDA